MNFYPILENIPVQISVPCRLDFGGTLDISTFYLPLGHLKPATFNLALDMRTFVTLSAYRDGWVKVSSRGFESAEFRRGEAPFDHPMGLMFACAQYFNAGGVHIHIDSTSPPRSALGGSSSAAVAVIAAFFHAMGRKIHPREIVWLAHYIESSVAGVPCGVQDQAAAAYGGAHLWEWKMGETGPSFERFPLDESTLKELNRRMLVAYCGVPHESKDVNGQWVRSFSRGSTRDAFSRIVSLTRDFFEALKSRDFSRAADLMIRETRIRLDMTPEVLDKTGKNLFERAEHLGCGARFTGAGGGGCIWAVGARSDLAMLSRSWQEVLDPIPDGRLLETGIESKGILIL